MSKVTSRSRRFVLGPEAALLAASVSALAAGAVVHLAGWAGAGGAAWAVATCLGLVAALWWVIGSARERRLGVDIVALLALAGALAIGEVLAGAVITVMLASGRALEARASARARRELSALLSRAPSWSTSCCRTRQPRTRCSIRCSAGSSVAATRPAR